MPSSGYGNFFEIGPFDLDLVERNHSWVKHFNVLFIDNPVGAGFSYISDKSVKLPTTSVEVASDLHKFTAQFLKDYPIFQRVPIYIFGESYGGKMAVEFSYKLTEVDDNFYSFLD